MPTKFVYFEETAVSSYVRYSLTYAHQLFLSIRNLFYFLFLSKRKFEVVVIIIGSKGSTLFTGLRLGLDEVLPLRYLFISRSYCMLCSWLKVNSEAVAIVKKAHYSRWGAFVFGVTLYFLFLLKVDLKV